VKVDGKVVGNTPLTMSLLPAAARSRSATTAMNSVKTSVEVLPKKVVSVMKAVAKKGSLASLRITSQPEAQIFLDDQPTGHWTNDGTLMLEPGVQHRVGLQVKDTEGKHEVMIKLKRVKKRSSSSISRVS